MADGIKPTDTDLQIAREGIMMQFRSHCGDATIEGLDEFIENQVRVIASERAYTRFLQNTIHKDLNSKLICP